MLSKRSLLATMATRAASKFPALFTAVYQHKNTKGESLSFDNRYALLSLYKDDAKHIVVMKCVQVGVSEWLIVVALSKVKAGWAVIYTLPIESLRNTFVSNRIDKIINLVPYYRHGIKTATGQADQAGLKHLWGGAIKFVGTNSESSFLEFPADMLIIDEIDKSDIDNLKMADDRLDASNYKFKRVVGNPSFKKFGIHEAFLNSDQKLWHIECAGCNFEQPLDWFKNVVQAVSENDYVLRDKDWTAEAGREINIYCRQCDFVLDRLAPGRWIAQEPARPISGYHFNQLFSPTKTIVDLWDEFIKAQSDSTKMQVFYNSRLGLPYEGVGDSITEALLRAKCMTDYLMPSTAENCTMGIDVGKKFHYRISDEPEPGIRRAVAIGFCYSIEELSTKIQQYNVKYAVIDYLPETRKSKELQAMHPDIVWLCQYTQVKTGFWNVKDQEGAIQVDRTQSIDEMVAAIIKGRMQIPKNFRSVDNGEYVDHLEAPTRKFNDKSNPPRYDWDEGGHADHYFHSENYDALALRIKKEIGDRMPHLTAVNI